MWKMHTSEIVVEKKLLLTECEINPYDTHIIDIIDNGYKKQSQNW